MRFFPGKISRETAVGALAFAVSVASYAAAMPGADLASLIWVWAVPPTIWAATRPRWRTWIIFSAVASWLGGVLTLIWLRNLFPPLGWLAALLLPLAYSAFPFFWMLALRFLFPRCTNAESFPSRMLNLLGLAGFWLLLEWLLTWVLSGFPWMPLGATQWQRPAMLAFCPWTGTAGASFMIIFFNLCVARYIRHVFVETRAPNAPDRDPAFAARFRNFVPAAPNTVAATAEKSARTAVPAPATENSAAAARAKLLTQRKISAAQHREILGAGRVTENPSLFRSAHFICPEFYCAIVPVVASVFFYWNACVNFAENNEKYFSFAAVQTNFDPQEKWDEQRVPASVRVLETLTLQAAHGSDGVAPDFILWPEAALPFSVRSPGFHKWINSLAARAGTLIVFGGIQPGKTDGTYYNSVHTAYPKSGLSDEFFAKRHLVPFGEYLPLADYLPFRKIVPAAADCLAGTSAEPLKIYLKNGTAAMGVLVCYEDVFPELGRDLARNGAEFIAVVTNDAWYGREAGAYQHAAHSVMQAVSLGVPVIRCGNAGWSGVINPLGHMSVMTDNGREDGTVYFRGQKRFDVYGWRRSVPAGTDGVVVDEREAAALSGKNGNDAAATDSPRTRGRTFYARNGNWLAGVGGLFFAAAYSRERVRTRRERTAQARATSPETVPEG